MNGGVKNGVGKNGCVIAILITFKRGLLNI